MLRFIVPGNPTAQGRQRFFRRGNFIGNYQPKKSAGFKKLVAMCAQAENPEIVDCPVFMKIDFYFKRPKKYCRKKDNPLIIPSGSRPDADNLAKAVMDALNGIVYMDDGQVWHLDVRKWYHEIGGSPHTVVEVEASEE